MSSDTPHPDTPTRLHIGGFHDLTTLSKLAAALAEASRHHGLYYIERFEAGWRWSFAHRGGPYPLLRTMARYLRIRDVRALAVPFYTVDGVTVARTSDDRGEPLVATLVELGQPLTAAQAHRRLEEVFEIG